MLIAIKVLGLQAFGSYPDVDIVCPCRFTYAYVLAIDILLQYYLKTLIAL